MGSRDVWLEAAAVRRAGVLESGRRRFDDNSLLLLAQKWQRWNGGNGILCARIDGMMRMVQRKRRERQRLRMMQIGGRMEAGMNGGMHGLLMVMMVLVLVGGWMVLMVLMRWWLLMQMRWLLMVQLWLLVLMVVMLMVCMLLLLMLLMMMR